VDRAVEGIFPSRFTRARRGARRSNGDLIFVLIDKKPYQDFLPKPTQLQIAIQKMSSKGTFNAFPFSLAAFHTSPIMPLHYPSSSLHRQTSNITIQQTQPCFLGEFALLFNLT